MSWRPIQSRMQGWKSKAADFIARKFISWAPKSIRDDIDRKVEADAMRLNEKVLDAQGYRRCHVCPERVGGGLRARVVGLKRLFFCAAHARALDEGRLIVG